MNTEAEKYMFDYLIKVSNGKLAITPEQLEQIIDISPKQQSILRNNGNFPIEYKKIGRLIYYPIHSIIKYLLSGESKVVEQPIKDKQKQSKTEDLSHIFMLRRFVKHIDIKIQELTALHDVTNNALKVLERYDDMKKSLCSKETT